MKLGGGGEGVENGYRTLRQSAISAAEERKLGVVISMASGSKWLTAWRRRKSS